ncbi:hypothetical protein [Georgenia thermotolerans]|uniref:Uncharacterized protein n=1 Tax=Georgenia thermotolerans TaxID=527326 RepID=A0A7J5US08_9MICO|nr:hypothetical protein [Georgenia thermotolerans]KAE8764603.1 hypothetical protein GB883_08000 [Georgenia thermotolerans]
MKVDPRVLLVGPRGRRLCLDIAGSAIEGDSSHAAEEYRLAVGYAAYDLDPGRGTSRVMFSFGGGELVTPHPSPADVARLLDLLPLVEPDEGTLLRGLMAAVDFARYWQEPDGEDVLAAAPEMREALARVAASVAQCPVASWWTTPLDLAAQWAVTLMEGPSPPTAVTGTTRELLAHWHSATVEDEARARRERPRDPRASLSGTWWSTPPAELTRTTRSLGELGPVGLWLVEDAFNWDRATARHVSAPHDVTVYEVEGPEAWAELCRRYPLEVTASRRHDWYRTTGIDARWVIPDWSRVAEDFDAVHVTALGYLTTAGRAVAVAAAEDMYTVLAGWNPDQTYWLTDSTAPASVEQTWRRNDRDSAWSQSAS